MLRYVLAAATLRAFSWSPSTMRLYRQLGNKIGVKKRATGTMPTYYFERIRHTLRLHRRYGILRDGDKVLELGTGWVHWEAVTSCLFFDIRAVLFDVWDNRQFSALKNYISQLERMLDGLDAESSRLDRAHRLIAEIKKATSFDSLYAILGFQYVVNPGGRLRELDKASFDLVVSAGVLEHIDRNSCEALASDIAGVLKPGGYSSHSIHIGDHLYAYDPHVSAKQYLRYSDRTWNLWFQNRVQYINRLQRRDWLELFQQNDLVFMEEEIATEDLSGLKISPTYQQYDEADLRCTNLKLLHRKPQ